MIVLKYPIFSVT